MNETLEQIVARVERELAEWPPHTVSNLEFARRLVAALGAQEPVAWMDETRSALTNEIECVKEYPSANWQPLYAAPVVPAGLRIEPELAAAQTENARLRNALEHIAYGEWLGNSAPMIDRAVAVLAIPSDDTALQQRLAEERGRCAERVESVEGEWITKVAASALIRNMK